MNQALDAALKKADKPTRKKIKSLFKKRAIEGFVFRLHNRLFRRGAENKWSTIPHLGQTENKDVMLFSCMECGWPCDLKHGANFIQKPRKRCGECKLLKERGWLKDAKKAAEHPSSDKPKE